MSRIVLFAVSLFFVSSVCSAQTKTIDSLKKIIRMSSSPRNKLLALRRLCEHNNSLSIDTLYVYARQLKATGQQLNNEAAISYAEQDMALYYASRSRIDTAIQIVSAQLKKEVVKHDPELLLTLLLARARLLYRNNQYKEALQELFAVITEAERKNNIPFQVMGKTGIGWLQLDMKQYADALNWFHKALATPGSSDYLPAYSALYSNLATAHQTLGNTDSALHYIRKAISNARQHETLNFLATSLRIYADILMHQKKYAAAENALKEMVEIRKVSDGSFFVNYDMSLLAHFYAQTAQAEKGIRLCKAVIDSAYKSGITTQLPLMYEALAANYKVAGQYKTYGETLEKTKALQDSLYTMNTGQLLAGLQAKYEIQKKENIIIQQKLDLVQKNMLFYALLTILLFASVITTLLFRHYRKRQQLKLQLLQEEERRKSERAILEAEEAERKRIAADLHDSLGAYAASIASNIDHLHQAATVENKQVLAELKNNSQAIVSQLTDTIWVLKKDALSLTAISDRVKLFIQRIAPSYPQVTIDVFEDIQTDFVLPPAQAFHLFQIIKEAVNNSLRHSRCTQVTIKITGASHWQLSVIDNGSGLWRSTMLANGGNGLVNMKARAHQAGWRIQWQTAQPGGTSVIVEPTTN
jgi:signal transduction histidine kinase